MSNDKNASTEAWKILSAASVPNISILERGINNWIATFGNENPRIASIASEHFYDTCRYLFDPSLGGRYECSNPIPHDLELEFEPKIKLERRHEKNDGDAVF